MQKKLLQTPIYFLLSAIIIVTCTSTISKAQDTDPVIARVNGNEIHLSTLQRVYDFHPQNGQASLAQMYDNLQSILVNQYLLAEQITNEDTKAAEYKKQREIALRQFEANYWVHKEKKRRVTTAKTKAFYNNWKKDQKPTKQFKAQHILLKTEAEAKAIIIALQAGSDFATLAKEKSTGPSAKNGGDLGWFAENQMVPEFSKAVVALKDNAFSTKATQTKFGWHVIKRNESRTIPVPSFEDVEKEIRTHLMQEETQKIIAEITNKNQNNVELLKMPRNIK